MKYLKSRLRRAASARVVALIIALPAALGLGPEATIGAAPARSPTVAPDPELVALAGHLHRLGVARFDAGEAPDSLRMGGLEVIFAKTPAQEQALGQLLLDQQNPKSAQYHRFLTPAQYGARFGASDATIASLANWLQSHGFGMGTVPAARGHLAFFGSKAQVEAAFHTRIHLFQVNGERHFANVSNPMIPAAFQSAVRAIRGLNDFYPRAGVRPLKPVSRVVLPPLVGRRARAAASSPDTFYPGSDQYPGYVGPTDFATIYDLLPAYQQGITGAGVTVAIAAQSDIDPSVLTAFWAGFGVSGPQFGLPPQQFSSIPVPANAGGNDVPQTNDANEDEAYLDTEIVGALAPGATLLLVRDANATTAAEYVIDQNLAAVLNLSFGACEDADPAYNSAISALWAQGASEGITITVSAGDAGGAMCTAEADIGKTNDVNSAGFAVNGLASTPYDLAVGGTDFNPNTEQSYWATGNQAGTLRSAASHIPEMVWNDSCANPVIASYYSAADPLAFCNTTKLGGSANPYIDILGGGGGLSSCTSVDSNQNCSGGYPQPSWQEGVLGIGSFGARALPDVSMIATLWLVCSYDTTPCDPTQPPTFTAGTGTVKVLDGTSAAAPSVAAILALVDQSQISSTDSDGRQGLVNPALYGLAASEYAAAATVTACNAGQGAISNPACVFYDVTDGSNAQPCSVANYNTNAAGSLPVSSCVHDSGDSTGIMAVGGTQNYPAGSGFDLATGLGSLDAANLIAAFQKASAPTGLAASASGQTVTLTWAADPNATGGYDVYQGMGPGAVSPTPVQRNMTGTTTTLTNLEFGQSYVFAIAAVSSTTAVSSLSGQVSVVIVPAAPAGLTVGDNGAGALSLTWAPSAGAQGTYDIFEAPNSGAEGTTPSVAGYSGTSISVSSLTPGKQYFFTVAAIGAGGDSAQSAEASGTVLPAAPSGLHATGGNGTVSLSWTAGAGAVSYDVYDGPSSGEEGARPVLTGIAGTGASISGLSNGTTYYFSVAAVNAGGSSPVSVQAQATPTAPKGGGGSLDWLGLGVLACLVVARSSRNGVPSCHEVRPLIGARH